jgi:hypothetical protein
VTARGSGGEEQSKRNASRAPGVVMALMGVGFLALIATQWQGRQTVDAVVVTGASGLSETAVRSVVDTLRTKAVRDIVFADVRRSVEALPYVRQASVYLSGACDLTIDVAERMPIAHIVASDGSLRYVDAEGTILPPAPRRLGFNIPLMRVIGQGARQDVDVRRLATIVVAAARTLDPSLYQTVSEIRYDASRGRVDLIAEGITWRVRANRAIPVEQAFADMNVFWQQAGSRLPAHGVEVDLTWRHQVVVRPSIQRTTV